MIAQARILRILRSRPIGAVLALLSTSSVAFAAPQAAEWKAAPATLTTLEAAAHHLAKCGREAELQELLEVLDGLAYPKDKSAKLSKACAAELATGKPATAAQGEATRKVRAAAKQLAGLLPGAQGESQTKLARLILRLDDSVEVAHLALGRERVGADWLTQDQRNCRGRRADIASALQQARRLEVAIQTSESRHPVLIELYGRPGIQVKCGNCTLETPWSAEKANRILREVLRASAFSNYLRTGELAVPKGEAPESYVLLDSRALYPKAIEAALRDGGLAVGEVEPARKMDGFFDRRGYALLISQTEAYIEAVLLVYLSPLLDGTQASLKAGHLNWVSMACFGPGIPIWGSRETTDTGVGGPRGDTFVAESASARKAREEHLRLARAGIAGCRSYMIYLAERRQDPPWQQSMLDQIGRIQGEDLLKDTSVIEFVQELDLLARLIEGTSVPVKEPPELTYARALGEKLAPFEARWRDWLIPARPGLIQRLDVSRGKAPASTSSESRLLAYLNKLRSQAFKALPKPDADVTADDSLSGGARMHAAYLNRHPEQTIAWPAAHEEYPDQEGFTPIGAWAGAHAVIHPGAKPRWTPKSGQ